MGGYEDTFISMDTKIVFSCAGGHECWRPVCAHLRSRRWVGVRLGWAWTGRVRGGGALVARWAVDAVPSWAPLPLGSPWVLWARAGRDRALLEQSTTVLWLLGIIGIKGIM